MLLFQSSNLCHGGVLITFKYVSPFVDLLHIFLAVLQLFLLLHQINRVLFSHIFDKFIAFVTLISLDTDTILGKFVQFANPNQSNESNNF